MFSIQFWWCGVGWNIQGRAKHTIRPFLFWDPPVIRFPSLARGMPCGLPQRKCHLAPTRPTPLRRPLRGLEGVSVDLFCVRVPFLHRMVRAVPVFGSDGSSLERAFCLTIVLREGDGSGLGS